MKKIKFGDTIVFDEIFSDVMYITPKNAELYNVKLYEDKFTLVKSVPINDGLWHEKVKYPAGYRKVIFSELHGSGIVIGQTMKKEGYYWPGYGPSAPDWDDVEPPLFDSKKTYTFWIVATNMNQKVLVPKESIEK